jgi:predicted ATPase
MLTRLKVTGFKNLVDVDVRFGPFTCIAGVNGVGKSNLFDAIRFLSALADRPFLEAAKCVRDEDGKTGDVRSLFHRVENVPDLEMEFEAEMIIPLRGTDDLGQLAEAGKTFLKYTLRLTYKEEDEGGNPGTLAIVKEELGHINTKESRKHLPFGPSAAWRSSVIDGRRTTSYISTECSDGQTTIELHQDGNAGRALRRNAANLPRTVLSSIYTRETPTVLLARREMQSWHLLQLEPSSLRRPDELTAPNRLGPDGSNLAATLYRLARTCQPISGTEKNGKREDPAVYAQIANRLSELIDDVASIDIERDDKRELLTLHVTNKERTTLPARALSDGTLRFLALAVLERDPDTQGVICLEEPENGIHPERIPAILQLLRDIAVDTEERVGPDNPLRQVIVNTHSPSVVSQVLDADLLVAEYREHIRGGKRFKGVSFCCLPNTWREAAGAETVARGRLLAYLNPVHALRDLPVYQRQGGIHVKVPRPVKDRPEYLPLFANGSAEADE